MSDTAYELDELNKKDRYLQWREHMRKTAPTPEAVPATPDPTVDWSPDSLFDSDAF